MKKSAILSILLCLCMVASLVVVPVNAAEVDTNVLDGVYEASFSGQVLLVLTFNNGKLTVKDMNMGQVTGDYTYTVKESKGSAGNIVYDENEYTVTVNVSLTPDGKDKLCDAWDEPEIQESPTRVAFFLRKSDCPTLETPYGNIDVSQTERLPLRLKEILEFEKE